MKKLLYPVFIILFVLVLVACTEPTSELGEGMIHSGDEIDGMLFFPLEELINWNRSLAFLCDQKSLEENDTSSSLKCSTLPGESVFFGNCNGILYDNPKEADEKWQDFDLEISFDGRVIDLSSFG